MQTPVRNELLSIPANPEKNGFDTSARALMQYQLGNNPLYAKFVEILGGPQHPRFERLFPFLPISIFKQHRIQSGQWMPVTTFSSSGTTGQSTSQHLVRDLDHYLQNTVRGFSHFYGDPSEWVILALLPAYLERQGSSLVAMADHFIRISKYPESGFFLHDHQRLVEQIKTCQSKHYKILLLGVSFALLDFAEQFPINMEGVTVMETGGMKGRRKEITRTELHEILKAAWKLPTIHSEYGMTELFSQAYALGGERFHPTPTMQVITTELNDPFCRVANGRTGILNIIDLANIDTCAFIQTEDLGRVYEDGSFEVIGRADVAETRGCNLMVE